MYTKLTWPSLDLSQFITDNTAYNCILEVNSNRKQDYHLALSKMQVNENLILVLYTLKYDNKELTYSSNYQYNRELLCFDTTNKLILNINSSYTASDVALGYSVLFESVLKSLKDYTIYDCRSLYSEIQQKYSDMLIEQFEDYFRDGYHDELYNKYASKISNTLITDANTLITDVINSQYVKDILPEELEFKMPTYESDYIINMVYKYVLYSNYLSDLVRSTLTDNIKGISNNEISLYVKRNIFKEKLMDLKANPPANLVELKNIYNLTKNAGKTLTIVTKGDNEYKVYNDLNIKEARFQLTSASVGYVNVKDIAKIKFNGKLLYES